MVDVSNRAVILYRCEFVIANRFKYIRKMLLYHATLRKN